MGYDMYMLDQLAKESEARLNHDNQKSESEKLKYKRGSNEDTSMAEAEKIADTGIGNDDVSATTIRSKNATNDLEKSQYVGNGPEIEYDPEFLDYQNHVIDAINIAYSSKPLYQYLVSQVNKNRGKTNSYGNGNGKIDTTAVSTIKVPTFLINCLKQETASLSKVKNGTMVVGFLVWYFGLNPDDFEDSEDIQSICNSLGLVSSPSKMSVHTGNMVQNIDDRLNDFEDTMKRLITLVEHVNTNMAQSEQDVGKVLMLSCYNALSLMGRSTLIKVSEPLEDIDILDNMKVWALMKSVESAWLYNSRSEGREQYKRKCERERKQVLYANMNNQVVNTYDTSSGSNNHVVNIYDASSGSNNSDAGSIVTTGTAYDYDDDDNAYPDLDEQYYTFNDDMDLDFDCYTEEEEADLDEAINMQRMTVLKDTDVSKYLKEQFKYKKKQ